MIISKEYKGKTRDDAMAAAIADLKMDRDDLSVEILENPRAGFLGFGRTDAVIRVSFEGPDPIPAPRAVPTQQKPAQPKPAPVPTQKPAPAGMPREPKPDMEKTVKPHNEQRRSPPPNNKPSGQVSEKNPAKDFVEEMLGIMGVEAQVSSLINQEESTIYLELVSPDMGFVIGRRGETLDALQYLATIITNKSQDSRWRVTLDSENYRDKRYQALVALANRTASQVLKTGKNVVLEPMSPQERRTIHFTLQDRKGISTFSTGVEPRRKVVIAPLNGPKPLKNSRGGIKHK